jgi:hypothetical protein
MKKFINTKKVSAAVCILTLALFIFPFSSFAWEGCVISNKGDIHDLDFLFDPPLGLELPIGTVYVTEVIVQASGKEEASITPFDKYIYESTLKKGWEYLKKGSKHSKKGIIIANAFYYTGVVGDTEDLTLVTEDLTLVFEFKEARIFESFSPDDPEDAREVACENGIIDPDVEVETGTLQLYIEVKRAKLVGMPEVKFNLVLKIDEAGGLVDVDIEPL